MKLILILNIIVIYIALFFNDTIINLQNSFYFWITFFYDSFHFDVNLTLCVQPTHPPNVKSKVKSLKKYTHNPVTDIYLRFLRLFHPFLLLLCLLNQSAYIQQKKSRCLSTKCWTFGVQKGWNTRITPQNMGNSSQNWIFCWCWQNY